MVAQRLGLGLGLGSGLGLGHTSREHLVAQRLSCSVSRPGYAVESRHESSVSLWQLGMHWLG